MSRILLNIAAIWLIGTTPLCAQDTQSASPSRADAKTKVATQPGNLFMALNGGDLGYLGALLAAGANSNARDPKTGCTLLMLADKSNMAKLLLDHGADPTLRDRQGATALHHAVLSSEALEIIPQLLAKGADINARAPGRLQETPFMTAIKHFFQDDPIYGAKVMQLLAQNGANIDAVDESGYTVLINAVVNDKPDLVRLMVELGADIHLKAKDGLAAIGWAQELGFVDIIELLETAQPN